MRSAGSERANLPTTRSPNARTFARLGAMLVVLALSIVGTTSGAAGANPETAAFQPDLRASANGGRTYVGDDIYNGGRGQAVARSAPRGTSAYFSLGLQIDDAGTFEDIVPITVTGCGRGNSSFNVRYYIGTSPMSEITSDVVSGGWVLDENEVLLGGAFLVEPATLPLVVEVKVKRTAPAGATFSCKVRAAAASRSDAVKVTARRS